MLKITDDNYNLYKRVSEVIWFFEATRLLNIDPNVEYSPVNVLNSWENRSKALAKKGLKAGLLDTLTMLLDISSDLKAELNELLIDKQLPSFYSLLAIVKDVPQKVLKAGRIKNLDQYYVVKEFLVDTSSELSTPDRNRLEIIFSDFEINHLKRSNGS